MCESIICSEQGALRGRRAKKYVWPFSVKWRRDLVRHQIAEHPRVFKFTVCIEAITKKYNQKYMMFAYILDLPNIRHAYWHSLNVCFLFRYIIQKSRGRNAGNIYGSRARKCSVQRAAVSTGHCKFLQSRMDDKVFSCCGLQGAASKHSCIAAY